MRRAALGALAPLLLVAACESGGGGGSPAPIGPGPNGSYLFVSAPDFYFGTRDVGTRATQPIELVNRGADVYPINAVAVTGEHAEEFVVELRDPITLNPSEGVRIDVTFAPIDQGRKFAELDIDFDTIVQAPPEASETEQTFYRARDLEERGDYQGSLDAYDDYIAADPVTVNKRRAAIKLPVIREAERYGSDDDFELYLAAMNARDDGQLERATNALDTLLVLHPDSYIADDALYLSAYIALIDREDYATALRSLQRLRSSYPDTSYYDTALYGEALAQQGLGNDALARSILLDLRARHTAVDALGLRLPKDDLVSRLWFERASDALAGLETA